MALPGWGRSTLGPTTVTSGLDHARIQRTLQDLCQRAGWPYAEAWRANADGTCDLLPAWYCGDSALAESFRRPTEALGSVRGMELPVRVLRSGRVTFVAEVTTDLRFLRRGIAARAGLAWGLGVPILAGETVTAVLGFFGRATDTPAEPKIVELAREAARRLQVR
ncbi:MAG TPA: GAF domain-containing protein [Actinomycetes bacterium]